MNDLFGSLMWSSRGDYETATEGGDHDVVILRRNGCLWPTNEEVLQLFDILHKRVVYNKLEGMEQWRLVGSDYAVQAMIKDTPMALLPEGHLRMYWEFGGFAPARELLKLGGFIEMANSGFMKFTEKSTNWVQQGGVDTHEIIMDDLHRHVYKLERHLLERVRRYELIPHMMRLTFRCTQGADCMNVSHPRSCTVPTQDPTYDEQG